MYFQLLLVFSLVFPVFLSPVANPSTQNEKITENELPSEDLLQNYEKFSTTEDGADLMKQETFYPVGVWWGFRPWGGWGGWGGYRPWYGWHGWHGWHGPHWGGSWGGHWRGQRGGR